jgi:hypothetical protein
MCGVERKDTHVYLCDRHVNVHVSTIQKSQCERRPIILVADAKQVNIANKVPLYITMVRVPRSNHSVLLYRSHPLRKYCIIIWPATIKHVCTSN